MRCKLDEHLPLEIKDLLSQHHHDAATVPEQGMTGNVDPVVAEICRTEAIEH